MDQKEAEPPPPHPNLCHLVSFFPFVMKPVCGRTLQNPVQLCRKESLLHGSDTFCSFRFALLDIWSSFLFSRIQSHLSFCTMIQNASPPFPPNPISPVQPVKHSKVRFARPACCTQMLRLVSFLELRWEVWCSSVGVHAAADILLTKTLEIVLVSFMKCLKLLKGPVAGKRQPRRETFACRNGSCSPAAFSFPVSLRLVAVMLKHFVRVCVHGF